MNTICTNRFLPSVPPPGGGAFPGYGPAPPDISALIGSAGAALTVSRSDHTHAHGSQVTSTHHAVTSPVVGNGFMPQSNFAAVVDPAVTDDSTIGYLPGSRWINTVTEEEWVCIDNTAGAAVWVLVTADIPPLSRQLYVDPNTAVPAAEQDGSIAAPFDDIQAAIDTGITPLLIVLQYGDYSAQALTVGPGRILTIQGPLRRQEGIITIGPIDWTVSGSLTSQLGLQSVGVFGPVTIIDDVAPATLAIFTAEGCQLGASAGGDALVQTGTSVVVATLRGVSLATPGTVAISMAVAGDIDIGGNTANQLLCNNVQFRTTVNAIECGSIFVNEGAFLDGIAITCNDTLAEFLDTRFVGASTITFSGAAGEATLDATTNYSFTEQGGTIVNGVKNGAGIFSAGLAVEPIAAALLPRFNSDSVFMTFVLGSQTDSNYGSPGNGGLYACARRGVAGSPPVAEPYVGMSLWDFGAPFAGAVDTGRTLYYGGGGWAAPDCHNQQFYIAPGPYSEVNDTGVLIMHMTTPAAGPAVCVGGTVLSTGGRFQVLGSINGLALQQRTAGADNTFAGGVYIDQEFALRAPQAGTLVAGNNNDFALAATSNRIRFGTIAAGAVLTGMVGGSVGRIVVLTNLDAADSFTITNDDAASVAANRFFTPGAVAIVVPVQGAVICQYDATSSRWIVIAKSL